MTRTSRAEGCLVKEHVEWEALVGALSRVLSVSPADIRAFGVQQLITPPPLVLVECHERESGFRMDLTIGTCRRASRQGACHDAGPGGPDQSAWQDG